MNNRKGASLFQQGNYAEAARHFQMAAGDRPHDADYVHNLASARLKLGDTAGAEQLYRRALNIDPMHQPSYHSLAKLLHESNRSGEAQQLLAMWGDTQPYIAEPQIEMAWLNRELGQPQQSEHNLRRALEIEPTNPTALAHLGQIYQDQGRSGEAIGMYQRSLYQDHYQPGVRSRLSQLNGAPWGSAGRPAIAQPMIPYRQPVIAQPMMTWPAQPVMAQPAIPWRATPPMTAQQPAASTVTLLPPIPVGSASATPTWTPAPNTNQPVQLGSPLSNADPAHADIRVSGLPVVPAY